MITLEWIVQWGLSCAMSYTFHTHQPELMFSEI
jgi:hypothetical protein